MGWFSIDSNGDVAINIAFSIRVEECQTFDRLYFKYELDVIVHRVEIVQEVFDICSLQTSMVVVNIPKPPFRLYGER